MARINLLPWRDWERERKKKEFLTNVGGVVVLGAVVVLAANWFVQGQIDYQDERNEFLQDRITLLDKQISEIQNLQAKRAQLLERMRVIQELQGNRPVIVRVFDELVQTLAKGVHYTSLSMSDKSLSISGVAESNNRISSLMRNIDQSSWFMGPNLKGIKEDAGNANYGDQAATFDLTFVRTAPNAETEN